MVPIGFQFVTVYFIVFWHCMAKHTFKKYVGYVREFAMSFSALKYNSPMLAWKIYFTLLLNNLLDISPTFNDSGIFLITFHGQFNHQLTVFNMRNNHSDYVACKGLQFPTSY